MTDNNPTADETAKVSEDKFNGTATLRISVPTGTEEGTVEAYARKYFRETHGTDPSKVVASKDDMAAYADDDRWDVMVADHSSGSLVDSKEYDL